MNLGPAISVCTVLPCQNSGLGPESETELSAQTEHAREPGEASRSDRYCCRCVIDYVIVTTETSDISLI